MAITRFMVNNCIAGAALAAAAVCPPAQALSLGEARSQVVLGQALSVAVPVLGSPVGDVIATLRANKEWIGHIHTGGVPGRNEIDETQELNYPAIMKAILDMNYDGYVGQEFIPNREPLASLAQGFRICDV